MPNQDREENKASSSTVIPPRHRETCSPELSIVVPLYNESQTLQALYNRTKTALDRLKLTYEIILIDDGSSDGTAEALKELAAHDPCVVAVSFKRNFGQTAAMAAGFDLARGTYIAPMDGDLQNDPEDIGRMLDTLRQGYDVVSGWRQERKDGTLRVLLSKVANALISLVCGVRLHDYGCSLKVYKRDVLKDVHLYGEMHRFIPIYASWQGAKVTEIRVTHHPRTRGQSHYGFERTLKVSLDLLVLKFLGSYLTKPIYVFGGFGLLSLGGSLLSFMTALCFKLMPPDNPWSPALHKDFVETPLPVLAVGLGVVGIQMMLIGLLAEMVLRTYYESQGKPVYQIKTRYGDRPSEEDLHPSSASMPNPAPASDPS